MSFGVKETRSEPWSKHSLMLEKYLQASPVCSFVKQSDSVGRIKPGHAFKNVYFLR